MYRSTVVMAPYAAPGWVADGMAAGLTAWNVTSSCVTAEPAVLLVFVFVRTWRIVFVVNVLRTVVLLPPVFFLIPPPELAARLWFCALLLAWLWFAALLRCVL